MDTGWLVVMAFPSGIALLLWSLSRDIRKENERPRRWWQKKKRWKEYRHIRTNEMPSVYPIGSLTPPSHHCGGHHYGGGDCG